MSILENGPQSQQPAPAKRVATQIVNQARSTFRNMVSAYNDGAKSFWSNPRATPQEIAAELGSDAAEVFGLHAKIGALLAEVKPDAVRSGQSVVGSFTINQDSTVTVDAPSNG